MSNTRNSIANGDFRLFKEYKSYLKTPFPVNVHTAFTKKLEEQIDNDLRIFDGKLFYHSVIRRPEVVNYNNIRSMIYRLFITNNIKVEGNKDLQFVINDMAAQFTFSDMNLREEYFGKYAHSTKENFTGKIIGGSYTRVNDPIIEDGIFKVTYSYHFDMLVPSPIYTEEYSKIPHKELKNRKLFKKDIIRPDGLGQTTLSFYKNIEVEVNLSTYEYSITWPAEDDISDECVLLSDDYNIFFFFEDIKNCKYSNRGEVMKLFNISD